MGESCSKRRRTTFKDTRVTGRCWKTGVCKRTNPAQLVLCNRARVHEGLGDHREHGIHVVRCLDVEDKLGILHNIDPETQRETGETVPTVLDMTESHYHLPAAVSIRLSSTCWSSKYGWSLSQRCHVVLPAHPTGRRST